MSKSKSISSQQSKFIASLLFALAGLIIFIFGLGLWWTGARANPQDIFWDAMQNSLQTSSVNKTVKQASEQGSIEQVTSLMFGRSPAMVSKTTLVQSSELGNSTVSTESLGTRDADYVRYNNISSDQKDESGQSLNFSEVIGAWAKQDNGPAGQAQFLRESVLSVVPFGNFSLSTRAKIMAQLRDGGIYTVDFNPKGRKASGRNVLDYDVSVDTGKYIELLNVYLRALGLESDIDPQDYEGSPPLEIIFTVDTLSRQLGGITYKDDSRTEQFSGYGVVRRLEIPENTITTTELQERLQKIR